MGGSGIWVMRVCVYPLAASVAVSLQLATHVLLGVTSKNQVLGQREGVPRTHSSLCRGKGLAGDTWGSRVRPALENRSTLELLMLSLLEKMGFFLPTVADAWRPSEMVPT